MKRYRLSEDNRPSNLDVVFSPAITEKVNNIFAKNKGDGNVIRWLDYLDTVRRYVSNPVIAWDYMDKHIKFPNGTRFIPDLDFNIGYTIKRYMSTDIPYVYIFRINLNTAQYDLKENFHQKIMVQLGKSHIRRIVESAVREYLKDQMLDESNAHYIAKEAREDGFCSFGDGIITMPYGEKFASLYSITNGYDTYHIGVDDGCYVIFKENEDGISRPSHSSYITPSLMRGLKLLPINPPKDKSLGF